MPIHADIKAFYESEAKARIRGPRSGRIVDERDKFISLLTAEDRATLVDYGCGPASDLSAFADAELTTLGIDLAHGNCTLSADKGLTAIQASITAPPFRPGSLDAGWSVSTLMHLSATELVAAMPSMVSPLKPGAPFFIGLWGDTSSSRTHQDTSKIPGQSRRFWLRTFDENRTLLEAAGTIEHSDIWHPADNEPWTYHLFTVHIPEATT